MIPCLRSLFFEWLARFAALLAGVMLVWYDRCDTFVTLFVLVYTFLDVVDMQNNMEVWDTLGFEVHCVLAAAQLYVFVE